MLLCDKRCLLGWKSTALVTCACFFFWDINNIYLCTFYSACLDITLKCKFLCLYKSYRYGFRDIFFNIFQNFLPSRETKSLYSLVLYFSDILPCDVFKGDQHLLSKKLFSRGKTGFNLFFFIILPAFRLFLIILFYILYSGKREKKIRREKKIKERGKLQNPDVKFFCRIFQWKKTELFKICRLITASYKACSLSCKHLICVCTQLYEHASSVCGNTEDKMEGAVFVTMGCQDFLPLLAKQKLAGYRRCSCIPHCFDFVFSEWLLQSSYSLSWDLMIFSVKADKNGDLFYCGCSNTVGVCTWIQGIRSPFLGLREMPPGKSLEKRQQFKFHIRFLNITFQCLFSGLLLSPVSLFSYFLIWQPLHTHVNDDSNASEAVVFNFY